MHFIGIDLAWSPRNPTGAAVIVGDASGGTLVDARLLDTDMAIVDYIVQYAGAGSAIVGVDAPLHVPNETGRRLGEAELQKSFGRYQAGAHPANRQRLAFDGAVRGETLVAKLEKHSFVHAPSVAAGAAVRQVIEVFPHPAMIALFGLQRTLKYKVKPKRSRDVVNAAWRTYQTKLLDLVHADPPLRGQEALLEQDVAELKGVRLKNYEDQIDALMCAYIALYAFRWGDARCRTFGTMEDGYIYTPVPPEMRKQIE